MSQFILTLVATGFSFHYIHDFAHNRSGCAVELRTHLADYVVALAQEAGLCVYCDPDHLHHLYVYAGD